MRAYFEGKTIVLGVTGSIAAYKACDIASRLVEAGAQVAPALTRSAREFIGAASLEGIAGHRAFCEMFAPLDNPDIEHIAVARRADLYLIAPASANFLAKAAHGLADDWLSTTLLATRAPVLFAPAMNTDMYLHPATQANIATLRERGAAFAGPAEGMLACRRSGPGRLLETAAILEAAAPLLYGRADLAGRHVLITSGPNHEPIDPVRYIGNRSSGRMGYALALEALCRGARVTVVTGPAEVRPPEGVETVPVTTAAEMHAAARERAVAADIIIGAAAVADYRAAAAREKHKRNGEGIAIVLTPNPDIIADLAAGKRPGQAVAGFAAETSGLLENAREKLERKGLDAIVANEVGGEASAIGAGALNGHLLVRGEAPVPFTGASKQSVASALFDALARQPAAPPAPAAR